MTSRTTESCPSNNAAISVSRPKGVLPVEMASTRLKSAANANNRSNLPGFMCRVP